jgi:uncharacterized protein (DUF427 family)
MSRVEQVKKAFISGAMKRAETGKYPVIEPTPEDNSRDLHWWMRVLDAKAFLISVNGSIAWLFPHYEFKLVPLEKRVIIEFEGETIVSSKECFEFRETAHSPQIYIPRAEVNLQHLIRTDSVTFCPFKNVARYYSVRVNGKEVVDAFWTYDEVYDKFPNNGNASDILQLKGMLSPYQSRLSVKVEG